VTVNLFDEDRVAPPTGRTPAYSSMAKFCDLLDNLRENGLPATFDRSFFGTASGGLIAQTRGTLRFFDLIDHAYRPTEQLRDLVAADEPERKAILRRLAEKRYPEEIKLSQNSGTHGNLLAVIRGRGLSGATADRAASFFVHLARHVDLPVSAYFAQGRSSSSANGSNGSARRAGRPRRRATAAAQVEAPVTTSSHSLGTKRSAYIDLLMKLANREDGELPPEELLDRIERALGYQEKVEKPMEKPDQPRPEAS
jgi:hypothetical protein